MNEARFYVRKVIDGVPGWEALPFMPRWVQIEPPDANAEDEWPWAVGNHRYVITNSEPHVWGFEQMTEDTPMLNFGGAMVTCLGDETGGASVDDLIDDIDAILASHAEDR